jgi:hypothetical protein
LHKHSISDEKGADDPLPERMYIDGLTVPAKKPFQLHYDDIFYHAACNVATMWRQIERALSSDDSAELPEFGDWNLDTGRDENGNLVFW